MGLQSTSFFFFLLSFRVPLLRLSANSVCTCTRPSFFQPLSIPGVRSLLLSECGFLESPPFLEDCDQVSTFFVSPSTGSFLSPFLLGRRGLRFLPIAMNRPLLLSSFSSSLKFSHGLSSLWPYLPMVSFDLQTDRFFSLSSTWRLFAALCGNPHFSFCLLLRTFFPLFHPRSGGFPDFLALSPFPYCPQFCCIIFFGSGCSAGLHSAPSPLISGIIPLSLRPLVCTCFGFSFLPRVCFFWFFL